jgi:hypothetical protein
MPQLICKRVLFYSTNDEFSFFEWVSKIRAIKKFEGIGNEIQLCIPRKTISDSNLRDLTALLYRYKIDMKQLRQFVNKNNHHWYSDKKKYWHNKVFGL